MLTPHAEPSRKMVVSFIYGSSPEAAFSFADTQPHCQSKYSISILTCLTELFADELYC